MAFPLGNKYAARHGGSRSGTYKSWIAMRARCYQKTNIGYKDYGGRGITVCERWRHSFENFRCDVGERPDGTSIDRIDSDGNYEPGNVRWATSTQQIRNRSNTKLIEYKGELVPLGKLAKDHGLSHYQLKARLRVGWTIERALTTPLRQWPAR